MNTRIIIVGIGIAITLAILAILVLCGWVAGPAGVLLGMFIVTAICLRFLAYLGVFQLPRAVKALTSWTVAIGLVSIMAIWGASAITRQVATIGKPSPEAREAVQMVQEKKIEVVAYPDRYTEVSLPYYHWFDFGFNEPFRVKLADGREFDFQPGQPKPFLGNEIPESRLYMKSLAGKEIKVTIFLRPKNS